jgi:hypothetical protein
VIKDWTLTPVNWARQDIDRSVLGATEEQIRGFATTELFPKDHNVGMLIAAKDGNFTVIEALHWKIETEESHVPLDKTLRPDGEPKFLRYRGKGKYIRKGELPCTLPVDGRNIIQCLKSLSDREIEQLYEDVISGVGPDRHPIEDKKGITWSEIESRIVYHPGSQRQTFVLITGKEGHPVPPAINANLEQIMKT